MKAALITLLATISILSACGGTGGAVRAGGGAPAASRGRSCGGDVVGSWTVVSSSISLDFSKMNLGCPSVTGSSEGVAMTGHGTYTADGAYTQTESVTGGVTISLPAPCIAPGTTCADLPSAFIGETFQAATCDAGGGGCTCKLTLAAGAHTVTGKYTTPSVGLLSETDTGESTAELTDYCVNGATMTQSPHPGSNSGISGSIVLRRQ